MNALLFLLFLIPMGLEGIGIKALHHHFLLYYLIVPTFLYLYLFIQSHPLHIPPRLTFFSILFFAWGVISLFFSSDKQTSFEYLLFSISLFLIFIFFYNLKKLGKRFVYLLICLLGILFIGCSLRPPFPPYLEKQLVMASYASHNHLVDFLGLLLILLLARRKRLFLIPFLSVFFFFIFSFSRSAYLAFVVSAGIFFFQKYKTIHRLYFYFGAVMLGVALIFFSLVSSQNISLTSPLHYVRQYVSRTVPLNPRGLFSGREMFAGQALQSIREHPLFGIGAGNFLKASLRYNTGNTISDSAHNLFLEITAEQGIPAALLLLVIIILILSSIFHHPPSTFYFLLYLLINFQTDYTYQIYLFPVLATVIAAVAYKENVETAFPLWLYGGINVPLLGSLALIITGTLLLKQNVPAQALLWYPLSRRAYIEAIGQNDSGNASEYIDKGLAVAPYDTGIILAATEYYMKMGQKEKALMLYERAYDANRLIAFPIMKQIYFLKKELRPPPEAEKFLREIIQNVREIYITESFKKELNDFCVLANGVPCM